MIYYIFPGQNKEFIGVWADPTANLNTARVYVGTTGTSASFFVIDLENKVLCDLYSITEVGRFNELLDQEDIIDINVSSAV